MHRDAQGNADYLSDLRVRTVDGQEYYFQWDGLARPTFFRDTSGASARVNFYLAGDQVDLTIGMPDGRSVRGITRFANIVGTEARARPASPTYPRQAKSFLPSRLFAEDAADLVAGANQLREMICLLSDAQWIGESIGALILIGGCVGAATIDVVTFPSVVETIAGCALAQGVRQLLIEHFRGEIICLSLELVGYVAEDALRAPLNEADPPFPPSQTGEVPLGTGSVHVTLTWDTPTDVDLHITDPFGEEIYYRHAQSNSGGQLDVDDMNGYGPENVFWPLNGAPRGQYGVAVVYYDSYGYGRTNYYVSVRYPDGRGTQVIEEYSGRLDADGERDSITTFNVQ